jgi:shikimate kinase
MSLESPSRLSRSISLVGLMGCGKTSVGEMLAKRLQVPFYDSDQEIERMTGKSIPEIFKEEGETLFRKMECEAIFRLLDQPAGILSMGGGAFVQEPVREILLKRTESVYLKANAETLFERVKGSNHRPLLQNEDPLGTLKKLLKEREPFYLQASRVIETEGKNLEEVAEAIVH